MTTPRDTFTYLLKLGNEVIYVGMTQDPERRAAQHRAEGKQFSHMVITSRRLTWEEAKRKEAHDITRHSRWHGRLPLYNRCDAV